MNIVSFPERTTTPRAHQHPHHLVRAEAARIENWLEHAQHTLAKLAGVEREDHMVLRRLADELLERLVD